MIAEALPRLNEVGSSPIEINKTIPATMDRKIAKLKTLIHAIRFSLCYFDRLFIPPAKNTDIAAAILRNVLIVNLEKPSRRPRLLQRDY